MTMTNREIEKYDYMVEMGLATEHELGLMRAAITGTWEDVFNAITYYDYGMTLEQVMEENADYYDNCDIEEGFDPYEGCYTFDC